MALLCASHVALSLLSGEAICDDQAICRRGEGLVRLPHRTPRQAACWQVGQLQSLHVQFAHASEQFPHEQTEWLHVGQVQSLHVQEAQLSLQAAHVHCAHSS